MNSHSQIQHTLAKSTAVTWKKPSDFKTESEFGKYFHTLPIETQIEMAEANIPVAQRHLASSYYVNGEHEKSISLLHKASANGDPVALLQEAQVNLMNEDFVQAKTYLLLAFAKIDESKDEEFISALLPEAEETKLEISENILAISIENNCSQKMV